MKDVAENIRVGAEGYFQFLPETERTLERMFSGFRQEEYEYLEYLSVMEHGTDVQQLGSILEENSVKVMKILDFLMRRRLLAETGGGKRRMLKIREKMVRDMIYDALPSLNAWNCTNWQSGIMKRYTKGTEAYISICPNFGTITVLQTVNMRSFTMTLCICSMCWTIMMNFFHSGQ
ncbi:MAG: hypothetical protein ACLRMZ_15330 [Blautia marasmi]